MKFVLAILLTVMTHSSFASQLPQEALTPRTLIKELTMSGNLMPGPGRIRVAKAEITFEVRTCRNVAEEDYRLQIATQKNPLGPTEYIVLLKYKAPAFLDCYGPRHSTEITLRTMKIAPHAPVKLGNPLLIKSQYIY